MPQVVGLSVEQLIGLGVTLALCAFVFAVAFHLVVDALTLWDRWNDDREGR